MRKKIVALVGMPGAGKSEAAEYFGGSDYPVLRFGDQTEIGLKEFNKELTQDNERWYREKLRKELGMAAYAIKIKPRIDAYKGKSDMLVLDGLYSWEEYLYLKKEFNELILLCIYARPKTRYARLKQRKHRGLDQDEARKRDVAELEKLNKGGPIAVADYLIINEEGIDTLHRELDLFLTRIQ